MSTKNNSFFYICVILDVERKKNCYSAEKNRKIIGRVEFFISNC